MEKSYLMKKFEAETGKQSAIVKFMCGGQALDQKSYPKLGPYDYNMEYIEWLESKAEAYDRLISGEPKHCPFCHGEIKPIDHPPFWMAINGSQIDVYVDGLGAMATTINYCPMCGRRLTLPDGWENKQ